MAKKKKSIEKINDPVGQFSEDELNEFHTKCENLSRDIRKCEAKWIEKKEASKNAKGIFDDAVQGLRSYIDGYRKMPLFSANAPTWEDVPIEKLDIEEWLVKELLAENVTTAGELDSDLDENEQPAPFLMQMGSSDMIALRDALDKARSEPLDVVRQACEIAAEEVGDGVTVEVTQGEDQ